MEANIINDNFVHDSNYKRIYIKQNMDYEEKYKKTLEKARKELQACGSVDCDAAKQIFRFFPELAESEDERIRKDIIVLVKDWWDRVNKDNISTKEQMIAWLEKQGEQKSADKVEPKFEIGDLITNGILIGKIDEINEHSYHAYFGDHYADVPDVENWHKWTIQDAKDGDVLCCESGWTCIFKALDNHTNTFSSYCFMDSDKWFCNTGSEGHTLDKAFIKAYNGEIHPATKEQRDILIKAIDDAGYTFDFEKKELKKVEQKSSWSEEDETKIKSIIAFLKSPALCAMDGNKGIIDENIKYLKSLKERVLPQPEQEWSEEDENNILFLTSIIEECFKNKEKITLYGDTVCANFTKEDVIDRLKSLRPQKQWKPSDEQMKALHDLNLTGGISYAGQEQVLIELYNDLKKL